MKGKGLGLTPGADDGGAPGTGGGTGGGGAGTGGSGGRGGSGGSAGAGGSAGTGGSGGAGGTGGARDAMATGGSGGSVDGSRPGVDAPRDTAPAQMDTNRPSPDLPVDQPPPPVDLRQAPRALLLVGQTPLVPGDSMVHARLVALGYMVTTFVVENSNDVRPARQQAAMHQLVYMSSTLPGGIGLPQELTTLPVPIICARPTSYDSMGWVEGNGLGTVDNQTQIAVILAVHPLAAGQIGAPIVTTAPVPFGFGQVIATATRVATINNQPQLAALFGIDKGAMTLAGQAPARRVGFFAIDTAIPRLNDRGWALFDAAVRWVTGQ